MRLSKSTVLLSPTVLVGDIGFCSLTGRTTALQQPLRVASALLCVLLIGIAAIVVVVAHLHFESASFRLLAQHARQQQQQQRRTRNVNCLRYAVLLLSLGLWQQQQQWCLPIVLSVYRTVDAKK